MSATESVFLSTEVLARWDGAPVVREGDVVNLTVPDFGISGTFKVREITSRGVVFDAFAEAGAQ